MAAVFPSQRTQRLRRSEGLTAPDARHFPDPTSIEVIRRITRHNALDPRLMGVDRHMQRWAASQGSGLPMTAAAADSLPRTKVPPLPDDQAVITDQAVLRSPEHWRRFINSWYRSPKAAEVIAAELGMRRTAVYEERRLVLAYLFGRLSEAGLAIRSYGLR